MRFQWEEMAFQLPIHSDELILTDEVRMKIVLNAAEPQQTATSFLHVAENRTDVVEAGCNSPSCELPADALVHGWVHLDSSPGKGAVVKAYGSVGYSAVPLELVY